MIKQVGRCVSMADYSEQFKQLDLARISRLRLLDDIFMRAVLKDNIEGVQLIIRIILGRNDIEVVEVRIQDDWPNLVGHSIRLDVTARDSSGKWYNIEIQRSSEGANPKRARYNLGTLDWHILPAGHDFDELPEVFIFFITETDVLGGGLPLYTIDRTIRETGEPFCDFAHILYANGSYVGNNEIGRLMADFRATDPKTMFHAPLAERARFYKTTEGGLDTMCKIMEEVRQEGIEIGIQQGQIQGQIASIKTLVKNTGWPVEKALSTLGIPHDQWNNYLELLRQ